MNNVISVACMAAPAPLSPQISPQIPPQKPEQITDAELDRQYQNLPKHCCRNRGISVTDNTGRKIDCDANLISLTYKNHILDVVASRAPVQGSFDFFWDLVRQNPSYLVSLANFDGANYLSYTQTINASECPHRNIAFSESRRTLSPSGRINLCERKAEFSAGTELSKRVSVPTLEVLSWEGKKGLVPADLHFLVLTLRTICNNFSEPGVIHCHYGKGRTAVLIIAMALKILSDRATLTTENLEEILKELITSGRYARDPEFVESAQQYRALYRYGLALCSGLLPQ